MQHVPLVPIFQLQHQQSNSIKVDVKETFNGIN